MRTTSLLHLVYLCAFAQLSAQVVPLQRPLIVPTLCDGQVMFYQTDNPTTALASHTLDLPSLVCGNAKPNAVAVHGNDLVVTVNVGCQRLYKFTNYITAGNAASIILVNNTDNDYVGCAFTPSGTLYAVSGNYDDNKLYRYASTSAGAGRTDFGNAGMTSYLSNIAFDGSGNIWVTDYKNSRLIVFNPATPGEYRYFYSNFSNIGALTYNHAQNLHLRVSYVLSKPEGLAFDASGNLWIGNNNDNGNNTNGTLVRITPTLQAQLLGMAASSTMDLSTMVSDDCKIYALPNPAAGTSDCFGVGAAARSQCGGLIIDKANNKLYVSEQQGNTVFVFDIADIPFIADNHAAYSASTPTSQPGNNGIAFGVNSTVLGVELLSFTGKNTEGGNFLTWATANEQNNKGFQIERQQATTDNWEKIGFKTADNKTNSYQFLDNTLLKKADGVTYYRLRQIDNDGAETLSKVIAIASKTTNPLRVYPNPVANTLIIENTEGGNFQIFNLLGQQVLTGKTPLSGAKTIDVSVLPQGTYVLKVGATQTKFVKQ